VIEKKRVFYYYIGTFLTDFAAKKKEMSYLEFIKTFNFQDESTF